MDEPMSDRPEGMPNLSSQPIRPYSESVVSEIESDLVRSNSTESDLTLVVPPELLSQAAKQGFLMKQGHRLRNWKRRWVFLAGPQLYYYKHPKDFKARGVVDLTNCTVQTADLKTSKPHSFEVTPYQKSRTYLFYTDSDETRTAWMEAILEEADKPKTMLRPHASSNLMFKTLDPFNLAKKAAINAPAPAGSSNVYLQVPEFDSCPPITDDMFTPPGAAGGLLARIDIDDRSDHSDSDGILSPTSSPQRPLSPALGGLHQHSPPFSLAPLNIVREGGGAG